MVERQKPEYDVVSEAAKVLADSRSSALNKRFAARILDDERNAPESNRTVPKPVSKADKRYGLPKSRR